MIKIQFYIFFLVALFMKGVAQERIKAAKQYQPGDEMVAPLYGIKLKLPSNWSGYLYQDSEVFSLVCDTLNDVFVAMYAQKISLDGLKNSWRKGNEIAPGIIIQSEENILDSDTLVYAALKMSNDNQIGGYGLARCGKYGVCYTLLLKTQIRSRDYYREVLPLLAESFNFYDPSIADIYDLYDWNESLSKKYLLSYESKTGSVKQNHLWLCPDGTFQAKILRKGLFKDEAGSYKGNRKGTYEIKGIGREGTLVLNFKKLERIEIALKIEENGNVYLNGNRFFISELQKCK